jgi:mono/diheme cytochrome c family protein
MFCRLLRVTCVSTVLVVSAAHANEEGDRINRGRYLVTMAGCNECHTEGYARTFGKVPEGEWMVGRAWGEMGPWGTTFPANVRLLLSELTEEQWIDRVRHTATRPPMPWYNLRVMTDEDLGAMYSFIRSLGASEKPAPAYLPPGEETVHPHVLFPADAPQPPRRGRALSVPVSNSADPLVHRGRYLAQVAWCNSCHTEGYAVQAGDVPEDDWLRGSTLGRNGAWGTTYPTNLRLYLQDFTEEQWIERARTVKTRPVMPWFALNEMSEDDLRALYRYIRLLGAAGVPAPAFLPPEIQPTGVYVIFPRPQKK